MMRFSRHILLDHNTIKHFFYIKYFHFRDYVCYVCAVIYTHMDISWLIIIYLCYVSFWNRALFVRTSFNSRVSHMPFTLKFHHGQIHREKSRRSFVNSYVLYIIVCCNHQKSIDCWRPRLSVVRELLFRPHNLPWLNPIRLVTCAWHYISRVIWLSRNKL